MGPPRSAPALAAWIWSRQRALLRLLKGEERARIGPIPRALLSYRQRFLKEFRSTSPLPRPLRWVQEAVRRADLVLSADYHAHPRPENTHLRWLQLMARSGRRITLALEMVSSRHQRALNEFACGRLGEDYFRRRICFDSDWGFPWRPYGKLLRAAIRSGCRLLALDHPERSAGASVSRRDRHAAALLARQLARHPREAVLVVAGEMHLAAPHLPAKTIRALQTLDQAPDIVTIFHGHEGLYFSAGSTLDPESCAALELGPGRFCVLQSAPWIRLLAHLHWLEGREIDHETGPEEKVVDWTARTLAQLAGIRLPKRHTSEEEIEAHEARTPWSISKRAIARLAEGSTNLLLRQPECRSLWLTLGRCLVDPPPRGRSRAPRGASGRGLALYRRLMRGKVGLKELRAALWSGADPARAKRWPPQIPLERS